MKDSHGNEFWHSVMAYLEAYQEHSEALQRNPKDPVALLMVEGFDPKVVRKFQGIRDRVRTFAEDLLKRRGAPASRISHELMSSARWKTHGQPITHADATQMGLPIHYLAPTDECWGTYWKLYCLQRIEISDAKNKRFLSRRSSRRFSKAEKRLWKGRDVRNYSGQRLYSASDLVNFLGCIMQPHSICVSFGARRPSDGRSSDKLLQEKGLTMSETISKSFAPRVDLLSRWPALDP